MGTFKCVVCGGEGRYMTREGGITCGKGFCKNRKPAEFRNAHQAHQAQVKPSGWVSVDERLPDTTPGASVSNSCWVWYGQSKTPGVASYSYTLRGWFWCAQSVKPSHWMPIEPPQ